MIRFPKNSKRGGGGGEGDFLKKWGVGDGKKRGFSKKGGMPYFLFVTLKLIESLS